ncbi:MAG: 50S ribosomal protein L31 [Deltaproteobacteria bacterium]|nr:50S ribosomal protein L31 [Deltaproteobacteria bacterium]
MRSGIHPDYRETTVTCACGNKFVTRSVAHPEIKLDICAVCHPFFTGKQKLIDTAGRVDRFRRKYAKVQAAKDAAQAAAEPTEAAPSNE